MKRQRSFVGWCCFSRHTAPAAPRLRPAGPYRAGSGPPLAGLAVVPRRHPRRGAPPPLPLWGGQQRRVPALHPWPAPAGIVASPLRSGTRPSVCTCRAPCRQSSPLRLSPPPQQAVRSRKRRGVAAAAAAAERRPSLDHRLRPRLLLWPRLLLRLLGVLRRLLRLRRRLGLLRRRRRRCDLRGLQDAQERRRQVLVQLDDLRERIFSGRARQWLDGTGEDSQWSTIILALPMLALSSWMSTTFRVRSSGLRGRGRAPRRARRSAGAPEPRRRACGEGTAGSQGCASASARLLLVVGVDLVDEQPAFGGRGDVSARPANTCKARARRGHALVAVQVLLDTQELVVPLRGAEASAAELNSNRRKRCPRRSKRRGREAEPPAPATPSQG